MSLRADEFELRDIKKDRWAEAREFIAKFHYSGGSSRTCVYAHGLFRRGENELLGVALWLPPTKPAARSVNRDQWRRVLALSRLCIHPELSTNAASFLLGRSIRLIKTEGKWLSLVTYADEFMNHKGQIYRATNWTYVGKMKGSPRWEDVEGRQVSVLSTKSRTRQQMRELGYRNVGVYDKHKFVMHLTPQRKPERAPVRVPENLRVLFWAIAV